MTLDGSYGRKQCPDENTCNLGHRGRNAGAACATHTSKIRFPDCIVTAVDEAILVAVGCEGAVRLRECVSPNVVVGCVDGAVAVVVALKRNSAQRVIGRGDDQNR